MSDPRVVVGVANLKITDGIDDATIDCCYLIVNPRQARLIAVQLLAGADKLATPWSAAMATLTAERDSLRDRIKELRDAHSKYGMISSDGTEALRALYAAAKVSL